MHQSPLVSSTSVSQPPPPFVIPMGFPPSQPISFSTREQRATVVRFLSERGWREWQCLCSLFRCCSDTMTTLEAAGVVVAATNNHDNVGARHGEIEDVRSKVWEESKFDRRMRWVLPRVLSDDN